MVQLPPRIIGQPLSARAACAARYHVSFLSVHGEVEYVFEVSDGDVPVVTWEPRFRDDMGGLIDSATPLFASLQALHAALKSMG
ncbi:MAG: hypothetical protein WC028_27105 [Candidatus Obscuribacterales bacterium]|jgi:hypothetical protein